MEKKGCLYWATIGWVIWLFKALFYTLPVFLIQKVEEYLIKKGKTVDSAMHKQVKISVIMGYILVWCILLLSSSGNQDAATNTTQIGKSPESEVLQLSGAEETQPVENSTLETEAISRSLPTAVESSIEETPSYTPAVEATEAVITGTPTPYEYIVYITDTGSKYHRLGCRYLDESCHSITLEEAQRRGYEPCKVCNP